MRKNQVESSAEEKRGRKREAGLAAAAALSLFVGGTSSQRGAGCDGGQPEASAKVPAGAPSVGEGSSEDKDGCGGSLGPGTQKNPPTCGEG